MQLFPAIDLQKGRCVRLRKGDFAAATIYEEDPVAVANQLRDAGAAWLHVVDLDGAQAGSLQQQSLVAALAGVAGLRIEVGGGVRSEDDVHGLLRCGAARIVIGSMAVKEPSKVRDWLARFGADKIVVALDVRPMDDGAFEVLTHGWQQGSAQTLDAILGLYDGSGLKTLLCTDVSRDGMMTGPNKKLYATLQEKYPALDILASGGISGRADLDALARQGLAGAIIGKAMYEGKLDIEKALQDFAKGKAAC